MAGNTLATIACGLSLVCMILVQVALNTANWTAWTLPEQERSSGIAQCDREDTCATCNLQGGRDPGQPGCGWCGRAGADGLGRCMDGTVEGPVDTDGKIDVEVCKGFNTTSMGWWSQQDGAMKDVPDYTVWEFDYTGCPHESDMAYGVGSTCETKRKQQRCVANGGAGGVCTLHDRAKDAWLATLSDERATRIAAQPGGADVIANRAVAGRVAYCYTLPRARIDQCVAYESLCGSQGRFVQAGLNALLFFTIIPIALSWVVCTGCCIPGKLKSSADRMTRFLQRLCHLAALSSLIGVGLALAVGVLWMQVHTQIALAYEKDACEGDACPHLGNSFWSVVVCAFMQFVVAVVLAAQSTKVTSKTQAVLRAVAEASTDATKYAEKKAKYDYAKNRLGADWVQANMKEPQAPEVSLQAQRGLRQAVSRLSSKTSKGLSKGLRQTKSDLSFMANVVRESMPGGSDSDDDGDGGSGSRSRSGGKRGWGGIFGNKAAEDVDQSSWVDQFDRAAMVAGSQRASAAADAADALGGAASARSARGARSGRSARQQQSQLQKPGALDKSRIVV